MNTDPQAKMRAFIETVKQKMQGVLADFSSGKLNRDQFHAVYEHYNAQLALAEQSLTTGALTQPQGSPDAPPTIAILNAHMGKAIGLVIYDNRTNIQVDTLGEFDVPSSRVAPILNDFSEAIQNKQQIDQRVEKMSFNRWLMFNAGKFTTIVCLFKNEPSPMQIREMVRLHQDFETANEQFFDKVEFDTTKLAYPFLVFIQRKLQPKITK
jgi:hypothetical protein